MQAAQAATEVAPDVMLLEPAGHATHALLVEPEAER